MIGLAVIFTPDLIDYPFTLLNMTSFYNGDSWSKFDAYYHEDGDFDDHYTAEDYERREYERNGWNEAQYDRQRW